MTYLLGSEEAEYRAQRVIQDKLEAKFSPALQSEMQSALTEMLAKYEATGAVPALPDSHQPHLAELWFHMVNAAVMASGDRILVQGKAMGKLETKEGFAELFLRLVQDYIQSEMIRQRIAMVAATTRRQIVDLITAGQNAGFGVQEIATNIRKAIPAISQARGAIIARTETHGASNYGAHQAAKATGLRIKKKWVSVEDHRTRDFGEGDGVVDEYSHRAMNGQTVDMDQPFKMPQRGGAILLCQHPGDPSLPAGAVINCRCQVAHIVED